MARNMLTARPQRKIAWKLEKQQSSIPKAYGVCSERVYQLHPWIFWSLLYPPGAAFCEGLQGVQCVKERKASNCHPLCQIMTIMNSEYWVLKNLVGSCSISLPSCKHIVQDFFLISPDSNLVRKLQWNQRICFICFYEYWHFPLPSPLPLIIIFNLFSSWVINLCQQTGDGNFMV